MPLDLAKIKSRLDALKNNTVKTTAIWKPTPGKHTIRVVPYAYNPENPFIELLFHYNINGKTYLSPSTFGRPDPIVEFSDKLKKSGDKDDWKEGRKLEPKMRTYVPVLVRGQESEGVKFWGMGKRVYQELLAIIADPDYGDITDLKTGRDIVVELTLPPRRAAPPPSDLKTRRDIVVELKTVEETGQSYPETTIRVKPNQTLAFDPTDVSIREKVKNQKNVTELFPELTYEELAGVMDTWLNAGDTNAEGDPIASNIEDVSQTAPTPEENNNSNIKSATAKAAIKTPIPAQNIADEFDNLFNV